MSEFKLENLSIGDAELNEVSTALANSGNPDAVTKACKSRDSYVRGRTARYTVPEDDLQRMWQAYVLFDLYTLLAGEMPANRKLAYDEAKEELQLIADGKSTYPLAESQPTIDSQSGADWGSEDRIC